MIARVLAAAIAVAMLTAPADSRVRIDGRFFTAAGKTYRPVFASSLSLLVRTPRQRARVLDDIRRLGFNGIRVFAGALEWAGQTPERARQVLPQVLEEARTRRLQVEVTAITDSATGYDVEQHLAAVSAICAAARNCLLEAANEYYHPTQAPHVRDVQQLSGVARRTVRGVPWALSAPPSDAMDDQQWLSRSGDYLTLHLDRGGGPWDQLARLRDLARVSERTGKPVLNNEPIGAAEQPQPGRRASDADFFFSLGALSRLFELGSVFHSEDGLHARPFGPVQKQAARAFVLGYRALGTDARLTTSDPSAPGSPVSGASGAAHVFAARAGSRGWVIVLGATDHTDLRWNRGWSAGRVLARRGGLLIVAAARR